MDVLQVRYTSADAPARFAQSLRETGFAVLTDHPIPAQLVQGVFEEWSQFFSSPSKYDYTFKPETQAGYFPFKTENAKDSKVKDLKEFYHLHAWGTVPQNMTDHTWELFRRMSNLATELLGWIDQNTPDSIRANFSMPLSQMIEGSRETLLRPIHYPPIRGDEEDGAIRAAAHEDINLITLLPAATAPGLQVRDTAGRWHNVACDPGSIAINAGDMLQMASLGYYKSTTHQVINPIGSQKGLPRYSMPLFLHPRSDVRLSDRYTAGSYLRERLEEIGLLNKQTALRTDSATVTAQA
jgi:isopenicillin N synthase-like dioxygenase